MSGGLNSNQLSSKVKDNEWAQLKNAVYYDGSFQMIPGFVRHSCQIGGSGSTKVITGICDYQMRDGAQFLVVTTNDNIYYWDTATNKMVSIIGALTFTNFKQSFVIFNDRLVGTNGNDAPWTWNGVGNADTLANVVAAAGGGAPPLTAQFVSSFNDRIVFLNYVDNAGNNWPARGAFCALDNVLNYTLATLNWEFETDDGQELIGGRQLGEKYIIFKRNSIGYVTGSFKGDWYVNRKWRTGVGCVSGHTIKTGYIFIGGQLVEVLIFMSHEGLKSIDESGNIYQMPIPAQGEEYKVYEYFDSLDKANFNASTGVFYKKRNWYLPFYRGSGSSVNDKGAIFDYNTNSFWPEEGLVVSAAAEFYNSTTGEFDVLVGSNDGIIYRLSETSKGIESTTELITNGSMEADSNWTSYGTPATNDQSAAQVYQGTWARRCITNAVGEGIYQDIVTVVGQRYRVYAYTFVSAGEVYLEKQETDGTSIVTGSNNSAALWTRLTVTFTAVSTTSRIIFRNNTTVASTFYVDDASCRCIEVDSYGVSKYYDFGSEHDVKFIREFVPFATATDSGGLTFTIDYDKGPTVTTTDTLILTSSQIDWSVDLDWDEDINWDSYEELSADLANMNFDRFRSMRYKVENNIGSSEYKLNKIFIDVISLGRRWYHAN